MTLKIRIHNWERKGMREPETQWVVAAIVCQLWSPFENVNCFQDKKIIFFLLQRAGSRLM